MATVLWLEEAGRDLDRILEYIEHTNPFAAVDLVETIIASGNALAFLPARHPVRHPGELRERPVLGTNYVLIYRIEREEDLVLILAVRHGARSDRVER